MNFYRQQHQYYCGIDLYTRTKYLCMLDREGKVLLHKKVKANPGVLARAIEP